MAEARLIVLRLYKRIVRNVKVFPSRGRDRMLAEIRAEFRVNAKETDPVKIREHRQTAQKGLAQLQAYTGLQDDDPEWKVKLEDHPLGGLTEDRLDEKLKSRGVRPEILRPKDE